MLYWQPMSGKIEDPISLNSEKNPQAFIPYFSYTCVLLEKIQLCVHSRALLTKSCEFGVDLELFSFNSIS